MTARTTGFYKPLGTLSDDEVIPTQMDWAGFLDKLRERHEAHPYDWVKLQERWPTRLRGWFIRGRLGLSADEVQVYSTPSPERPTGDIAPNEIRVNETPPKRNLLKIERQKNGSVKWDTWVRLTPPATLSPEQVARVEAFEKRERQYAAERERVHKLNTEGLSDEERQAQELRDLPRRERKALEWEIEMRRREELVRSRREARESARAARERLEADRAEAIRIHTERVAAERKGKK